MHKIKLVVTEMYEFVNRDKSTMLANSGNLETNRISMRAKIDFFQKTNFHRKSRASGSDFD